MLQIIIPVEFRRVRDGCQLGALGPLGFDKAADQFLREYAAGGQIVMVGLQSVQGILQAGGKALELGLFLLRQVIQVHVIGTPAVRKSALFADDLTRNLRLVRKSAHFTDKRTQKIQATIKSQQFWGRIERPQITFSLKLNLHDNMLNILDI